MVIKWDTNNLIYFLLILSCEWPQYQHFLFSYLCDRLHLIQDGWRLEISYGSIILPQGIQPH